MRISDWSSDVCSSDLLRGIAADTFAGDLHQLDHALRIDDEGRAIGEALAIAQDIEIGRERVVLVAEHEEIDLADRGRAVMPRLVAEMRVGRDAVYLDAHLLERRIDAGQILEFGRADEGDRKSTRLNSSH